MIALLKKRYVYFDVAVLQDEHCEALLEELLIKRKYVYVFDQAEEEIARSLDNFDYISDVVYANEEIKKKQSKVCFITQEHRAPSGFDSVKIGAFGYSSLSAYIDCRNKYEKKRRRVVNVIFFFCVLYYVIYFFNVDSILPHMSFPIMVVSVLPAIIFVSTLVYAIYAGIYSALILFAFLDGL